EGEEPPLRAARRPAQGATFPSRWTVLLLFPTAWPTTNAVTPAVSRAPRPAQNQGDDQAFFRSEPSGCFFVVAAGGARPAAARGDIVGRGRKRAPQLGEILELAAGALGRLPTGEDACGRLVDRGTKRGVAVDRSSEGFGGVAGVVTHGDDDDARARRGVRDA